MPDPLLTAVTDEISAVLKKHDVAGVVLVTSKSHSHYVYELTPSWTCCFEEERAGGRVLRFRAFRKDYPSKEAQAEAISNSVGMVMGLMNLSAGSEKAMERLAETLGKVMNINSVSIDESPRFSE